MSPYRVFSAVVLSFLILFGYQYLYVGFAPPEVVDDAVPASQVNELPNEIIEPKAFVPDFASLSPDIAPEKKVDVSMAKMISVDTDLYTATISENGGKMESFVLKGYKETMDDKSPGVQLVKTNDNEGFPLGFSWGSVIDSSIVYSSEAGEKYSTLVDGNGDLVLVGVNNGVEVKRRYTFNNNDYLIGLDVSVKNVSDSLLQGSPALDLVNKPFQEETAANRFLFSGPTVYTNASLEEVDRDDLKESPQTITGNIDWSGYGGTYFLCATMPEDKQNASVQMQQLGEHITAMRLSGSLDTLQPGEEKIYQYKVFLGPKKLSVLETAGYNLDKAINFGWFDVVAKPTLWLLNFFYGFVQNYGVAIILVTIIFKAIFWPITQKGLKSMKNMQKLQPKMVALKEKYKGDPARLNQETMNLYKTYKVSPLGGCMPMVLQIPVFFALYKVLLQCIELRHAPFMLWITDLSAPDRLWLGFDIPYLGGLPVLTLLMGGSMFLQQKMTPTTADPTQAKIMMFLPVLFTFMFINFSSGLVLYWLVNNLLAIFQQQMLNRQNK